MKKLLLFALSLGFGSFTFAQGTPTNLSVNTFVSPTGTIYIDGTGTGAVKTSLEITIQNNDAAVTFNTGAQMSYGVSLDGIALSDPTSSGWVRDLAVGIAPTETQTVLLTSDWAAQTTQGSHELCVSLNGAIILSPSFELYNNVDANKELCANFDFDFTASVDDLSGSEITQITTQGDVMTVFVKNSNARTQIQIMSITGQVVKTINTTVAGQNFYQEINISDLHAGVYIVSVKTENGASTAKKVFVQ